jgi:hypothetical protein
MFGTDVHYPANEKEPVSVGKMNFITAFVTQNTYQVFRFLFRKLVKRFRNIGGIKKIHGVKLVFSVYLC